LLLHGGSFIVLTAATGLLLPVSTFGAQNPPKREIPIAVRWIDAVRAHQPGTVDAPLLEVGGWQGGQFRAVLGDLRRALKQLEDDRERNDALRRGILLHTDIALLTPDRAANFTHFPAGEVPRRGRDLLRRGPPPGPSSVSVGGDGQFLRSEEVTAHWQFARTLVAFVRPDPSTDPFVVRWYRAMTASFERAYELGFAAPHLEDARKVLPRDPWILLYSGGMHEALAAPRFRSIDRSRPPSAASKLRSVRDELENAVKDFEAAAEADPAFAEAHLRLGRTLGLLQRHGEALAAVKRALSLTDDPVLRYYGELFAGAQLEALKKRNDAREAFERAAALFPAAQTPLVALSELARRFGDRTEALAALQRLARLPSDPEYRFDPWWIYLRSYAWNARALLEDVRQPFRGGGAR
jgi:tetratricopeptide (TPR) repeat protein